MDQMGKTATLVKKRKHIMDGPSGAAANANVAVVNAVSLSGG